MRLAGMREPGSGSGRPGTGQRAESAGVSWKPRGRRAWPGARRPRRVARCRRCRPGRRAAAAIRDACAVRRRDRAPDAAPSPWAAGSAEAPSTSAAATRGDSAGGVSRGAESCPAARSGGWPQAAASHARGMRRRIGVMAVDRSRNRGAPQARGATPSSASCRSCTRDSVSSDTIAPISASCMSHWVSHGSPWVPRKSVAAEPLGERGPELDQLVEGAEGEAEADHHERQPAAPPERRARG